MADYINSNILAQAYIHVNPKNENMNVETFKDEIEKYSKKRIHFFISENVDIDIEISEGSLIAKITVYGTVIGSLMGGMTSFAKEYPDFREGVKVMYSDVTKACDSILMESLFYPVQNEKISLGLNQEKE